MPTVRMRFGLWASLVLCLSFLLVACGGDGTRTAIATPSDPLAYLQQVIDNLRQTRSFKMLIEQRGVPYAFSVTLDQGTTFVNATMQRAEAQFIPPDSIYGTVRLALGGLPPVGVEIYAKETDQWFKLAGSGWINFPIAEGFDPSALIKEGSGFSVALNQLRELQVLEVTRLESGQVVQHLRGRADGNLLNDLLFELIKVDNDNVQVDVYIDAQTNLPALLSVVIPETAANGEADTEWRIELFDYNAEADFSAPTKANP